MAYLMTLFGLIVAVVIFIYTINLLDTGKRTLSRLHDPVAVPAGPGMHREETSRESGIKQVVKRNASISSLSEEQKDMIPQRICPLCRSVLKRDEPLYACNTYPDGKRTILIYGCQHCYRPKKKSEHENTES